MKNSFRTEGDVTHIALVRKNGEVLETCVDTDDLPLLATFHGTWQAWWERHGQRFYASAVLGPRGKQRQHFLHRFLMGYPKGMVIDHIDHDGLNNRRTNMRVVTNAENVRHLTPGKRRGRRGGYGLGVTKTKSGRWQAQLTTNGVNRYLGVYSTPEEAAAVVACKRQEIAAK